MPIIVVARLRLRDHSLLDEFFTHAAAVIEQAQKTDGNLGVDALAEAHDVWWDVTAWQGKTPIETFMNTEPHLVREHSWTICATRPVSLPGNRTVRSFPTGRPLGAAWWPTVNRRRLPILPRQTKPEPSPLQSSRLRVWPDW